MASPGHGIAPHAARAPGRSARLQMEEWEDLNSGPNPVKTTQRPGFLEPWRRPPVLLGLVCEEGTSPGSAPCFASPCNLMAQFASL